MWLGEKPLHMLPYPTPTNPMISARRQCIFPTQPQEQNSTRINWESEPHKNPTNARSHARVWVHQLHEDLKTRVGSEQQKRSRKESHSTGLYLGVLILYESQGGNKNQKHELTKPA